MVLEASNVSLRAWNTFGMSNWITWASLSSFIGMPIVLVIVRVCAQAAQSEGLSKSAQSRLWYAAGTSRLPFG